MRVASFMAIGVLVLGASTLRADEEAKEVIKKAIMAHGGEKNLAKFLNCDLEHKGTYNLGGITYNFGTKVTASPEKFNQLMVLREPFLNQQFGSTRWIYTGEEGLFDLRNRFIKIKQNVKGESLREFKTMAHERKVRLLVPLLNEKGYELTFIKDDKANLVRVERTGEKRIDLFFDKASHELTQSERDFYDIENKTEAKQMTFYKKFKKVDGADVRYTYTIWRDDKQVVEGEITMIRALPKPPKIAIAKEDW